jgi:hypothetical protein
MLNNADLVNKNIDRFLRILSQMLHLHIIYRLNHYIVVLSFMTNEDKTVAKVKVENDQGYNTIEEFIKAIRKSHKDVFLRNKPI